MRRKCVEDEFGQGYTFGNQDEEYDSAERTYRVEFVKEDKEEDSLKITFYRINGISDDETIHALIKFLKSLTSFGRFKGGKRLKIKFSVEDSDKENVPALAVKEYFSFLYKDQTIEIEEEKYNRWW